MIRCLALGIGLLALAGCAQRGNLEPKPGHAMPQAPYGRDRPATVDALLTPTPQAVPDRNVELRKRSEPRSSDPFDLPPAE